MVQLFASHFGDFASVGRFLFTCKEIFSSPSAPGVWKAVAEKMYKLHRVLPLSFDYTQYIREKIVWTFPINWEAVETSTRPSGRSRAGVTRVGDKVLVVGGHTRHNGEFVRERDIWCFDTETDSYSQITTSENAGPPQISRLCLESFDDTVYSFGGILQDKTKINTVYSFDLTNKEWKAVNTSGTAPTPRCDPITCAYTMNESKKGMIVLGGSQEGLLYYSDVHFFDVVSKTWERVVIDNEGPSPRIGATAAIIDHKLYVYGGAVWDSTTATYTKHYEEMWCLQLGTGPWHWELLPNLGQAPTGTLVNLTAVPIGNHLLVEGIMDQPVGFVYDTVTYSWSVLSSGTGLQVNTSNFSSAVLVNSTIYYLCGYRDRVLAQDVIKLEIGHIFDYVASGTLPAPLVDIETEQVDDQEEGDVEMQA